jgi:methylthioribose-1-phosphate isomerase
MREPPTKPIEWRETSIRIIDQRELPGRETWLDLTTTDEVAAAIKTMALRGAPLIGIAAAMGVALESRRSAGLPWDEFRRRVDEAARVIAATRPTACNLFWALKRMSKVLEACTKPRISREPRACSEALVREALAIYEEDLEMGRRMGEIGAELIKDGMTVLTHCNAGGLATSGYGTAVAPMYVAKERGVKFKVIADETRPLFQGSRLTAWELRRAGIDVTVICDSACHSLMARGKVNVVFVGSDRITSSGDFANKIGTYGVALSAKANGVPFYAVAPSSTIDFGLERGTEIPIEERNPDEVTVISGKRIAPEGVAALNPAFDVTPHELVTGIITEHGLISRPFREGLQELNAKLGGAEGRMID